MALPPLSDYGLPWAREQMQNYVQEGHANFLRNRPNLVRLLQTPPTDIARSPSPQ